MSNLIQKRMLLIVAIALFSVTNLIACDGTKLPIPDEILAAKHLNSVIQNSKSIGTADKRKTQAEFQNVENQFGQVWKPLEESLTELQRNRASAERNLRELQAKLEIEGQQLAEKIRVHNEDTATPAATYNQQAESLNADIKAFEKREIEEQEILIKDQERREKNRIQDLTQKATAVETWLAGPSLGNFMNRKTRLSFTDGQAMKQLRLADKIGGIRD